MNHEYKIGTGFDAHRLVDKRPLILAGVKVDSPRGALGHSDADVACHALIDAILGALGEGDIGDRFPDTDPAYKDASSLGLLGEVAGVADRSGFKIANADVTIILESPKISLYRDKMKAKLASALGIGQKHVGVKATTTEGLGLTGRGEGVAAQAAVLIRRIGGSEPCGLE